MSTLLVIDATNPGEPILGAPLPERIIAGNPSNKTWDLEKTPDGKVESGVWEVAPGSWNVVKDCWEFMQIVSGHSELTEDGGETVVLKPGVSFVMRPGFRGVWTVIEPTRKIWITYTA
ncbi:cupin domain-containing protein [Ancylobacter sonchi]|uniref:cupin domain-containing protein n=1 Tax=Ancylobacter sonchi TaxID=1937790 RepID=UPI001BD1D9BC|nr:cupin domain-containing protein [Ancylobacter sonchi]MBS7534942.1 cupin domain-containing protein [Ancylobacter sonchi]